MCVYDLCRWNHRRAAEELEIVPFLKYEGFLKKKKKIWLFSTSEGRHFKTVSVTLFNFAIYVPTPPKYISEKINGLKMVMQGNQGLTKLSQHMHHLHI